MAYQIILVDDHIILAKAIQYLLLKRMMRSMLPMY
jgi:hypothetical protein